MLLQLLILRAQLSFKPWDRYYIQLKYHEEVFKMVVCESKTLSIFRNDGFHEEQLFQVWNDVVFLLHQLIEH